MCKSVKSNLRVRAAVVLMCFFLHNIKAQSLWNDVAKSSDFTLPLSLEMSTYRSLSIDFDLISAFLLTDKADTLLDFPFPLPEGGYIWFKIALDDVIPPMLAAKYPRIRAFTGFNPSNPQQRLKLNIGSYGLSAYVLDADAVYVLDPAISGNTEFYASYSKGHAKPIQNSICHVNNQVVYLSSSGPSVYFPGLNATASVRKVVLAVAATGEVGDWHGGSVDNLLSEIAVQVHRVNAIFERDLSVHFTLAEGNDTLLYTHAQTDPFLDHLSLNGMLNLNQVLVDSLIGSSNYDVAHLFGVGAGTFSNGVALLSGQKAKGYTGVSALASNPFTTDAFAHSLGHQFGANHTQNNACLRIASSAFEPGSGSTLMSLAGGCTPNLQLSASSYFHNHSIHEIQHFLEFGPGMNAFLPRGSVQFSPVITVDTSVYYIPKSTPFKLQGQATDAEGNTLLFNWEQYNLGPTGQLTNPAGNAPVFRSTAPGPSAVRYFPALPSLINEVQTDDEVLPSYSRNLRFRLTVRDNHWQSPAQSSAQVNLQADGQSGPFKWVYPAANGYLVNNRAVQLVWDVANTNLPPVNCQFVNIYFSADSGSSFLDTLFINYPNIGSANWFIPANLETRGGRLWIEAADNIFFQLSSVFEINNKPLQLEDYSVKGFDVYPNPIKPGQSLTVIWPDNLLESSTIGLYDLSGRKLFEGIGVKRNEVGKILIPDHLQNGMYILEVESGSIRIRERILIQ